MNAVKLIVTKSNLHIGNESKFYTAKARDNNINFNITYDCKTGNIIIHEWYKLNKEHLAEVTAELKKYFKDEAVEIYRPTSLNKVSNLTY